MPASQAHVRTERVGRRDRLTVTWQQIPPNAASGERADEH